MNYDDHIPNARREPEYSYQVTMTVLKSMPAYIEGDSLDDICKQVQRLTKRHLTYEIMTDQIDVYEHQPSGRVRRFAILMA